MGKRQKIPWSSHVASWITIGAACLAFSAMANGQAVNPLDKQSTSKGAVCPLSEAQTQKSIEAFAKLVPVLTLEPRCVNCHGGVDPFSDEVSGDHSDPSAPRTAHGAGKVEPGECKNCHSAMLPKSKGGESTWRLANPEHTFLGKNAKTLCKQMRDVFMQAEDFIGHLKDDNGNSNFTGTAFLGNRGLNEQGQSHVDNYKLEPPMRIKQVDLINLGEDWVRAMGGEFKGDSDCGCEAAHYALRISAETIHQWGPVNSRHVMAPVEVPITFHDDGTFTSEDAQANFQGAGTAGKCQAQMTSSLSFKASGDATEEWQNNFMHLKLEKASPTTTNFSAQCPAHNATNSGTEATGISFDLSLTGTVNENADYIMPPLPGITSVLHTTVVRVDPTE